MIDNLWLLVSLGMTMLGTACVIRNREPALQTDGTAGATGAPRQSCDFPARHTIRSLLQGLANGDATTAEHPEAFHATFSELVMPALDIEDMTRRLLDSHWRSAGNGESQQIVSEFGRFLVRNVAAFLLRHTGDEIYHHPVKLTPGGQGAALGITITRPGIPAIPVVFRLNRRRGDWKIDDILIDGTSLVPGYRLRFSRVINGGDIRELISVLAASNDSYRASAR